MSLYIKFFGLALMLFAAMAVVRGYREYNERRISELSGFLLLLSHLEGQISRYLTPISEALSEYSDENLAPSGFISEISRGEGLYSAFTKCSSRLAIGNTAKKILEELFRRLGIGYKEEVLADIKDASERLCELLRDEKVSTVKNERVVTAVTACGVLGVFILLV